MDEDQFSEVDSDNVTMSNNDEDDDAMSGQAGLMSISLTPCVITAMIVSIFSRSAL